MILREDLVPSNIYWIINFFWSIVISLLYDEDYSLHINVLDTLKILGIDNISFDLSFFEESNILRILKTLEDKKNLFYHESKDSIRRILK